jgi:hypothetical protein
MLPRKGGGSVFWVELPSVPPKPSREANAQSADA